MSNEQETIQEQVEVEAEPIQVEDQAASTETIEATPTETPEEVERRKHSGSGFKKRIDKMGAKIAELERQLAEKAALTQPTAPPRDPGQKPKVEDFDDYDKYEDAVEGWRQQQAVSRVRAEIEAEKQREVAVKQAQEWESKMSKAREKHPDLDDLIENLSEEDIPLPPYAAEFFRTADCGVDVLVDLARNPEEARRIMSLDPVRALRELTRRELSFDTQPAGSKPRVSSAPPPPKPLNPQGSPTTKRLSEATSYEEYQRLRRAGVHE